MSAASQRELVTLSRWIDDSYDSRVDPETVHWRRVAKVAEEAGEAVSALGGFVGENPRKGYTHSREDVTRELLDTAVAALGAVEHLYGNTGRALELLDDHIAAVAARAGLL